MAKIYFFSISERGANDEEQANKQRLARGVLVWSVFLHLGAAAAREGTGNRTLRTFCFLFFQPVRYSIYLYPQVNFSFFIAILFNPLDLGVSTLLSVTCLFFFPRIRFVLGFLSFNVEMTFLTIVSSYTINNMHFVRRLSY